MIGNLVGRSEQIENEAVQQTDLRTRRAPACLAFADHMNRLVAGNCAPSPEVGASCVRVADRDCKKLEEFFPG